MKPGFKSSLPAAPLLEKFGDIITQELFVAINRLFYQLLHDECASVCPSVWAWWDDTEERWKFYVGHNTKSFSGSTALCDVDFNVFAYGSEQTAEGWKLLRKNLLKHLKECAPKGNPK